ncbi:MFS transporter [Pararobbsia alpina]|uniref:MFS transporter n=1 Tax=Pararobbsia alpina TaxID=621374 RepID=UPI0039A700B4
MSIPHHERRPLQALASANFALGSMSYGVVGALPALAHDWAVTPGHVALLVAAFSITFAVGAPVLQMLFGHMRRRTLLLAGLAGMAIGSIGCALAPNFAWLLVFRVLAGIGAGAVSPLASAIGAGLVPGERQGRALAIVFVGVTLSSVISAPVSAWVAHVLGWRAVFALLATLAIASAGWIVSVVDDATYGIRMEPKGLIQLLTRPATASGLSVVLLQTGAFFATYTLILPLLHACFGASLTQGAAALFVFGVTGIVGNLIAQRASQHWSADRLLLVSIGAMASMFVVLGALSIVGGHGAVFQYSAVALLIVWALAQDLFYPSQMRRAVSLEPPYRGMVLALNSSGIFAGVALGSSLGGHVADHFGVAWLALVSAALSFAGLGMLILSRRYLAHRGGKACTSLSSTPA